MLYVYVTLNRINCRTLLLIFLMLACYYYYIYVVSILHPINPYCGQWTHIGSCKSTLHLKEQKRILWKSILFYESTLDPVEWFCFLWNYITSWLIALCPLNPYWVLQNNISYEFILRLMNSFCVLWIHLAS